MKPSALMNLVVKSTEELMIKYDENVSCEAFVHEAIIYTFDLYKGPKITEAEAEEYKVARDQLYRYFGKDPYSVCNKLENILNKRDVSDNSPSFTNFNCGSSDSDEDGYYYTLDYILGPILSDPPEYLYNILKSESGLYCGVRYSPLTSTIFHAAKTCHPERDKFGTVLHFLLAAVKLLVLDEDTLRDCYEERERAIKQIQKKFFDGTLQENDPDRFKKLYEMLSNYIFYTDNMKAKALLFSSCVSSYETLLEDKQNDTVYLDELLEYLFAPGSDFDIQMFLKFDHGNLPKEYYPRVSKYKYDGLTYSHELVSIIDDIAKCSGKRTCEEFVLRVLKRIYLFDGNEAPDYERAVSIIANAMGKLPILAIPYIEKYMQTTEYQNETILVSLDDSVRKMLIRVKRNNKKAVFVGDLLEDIFSSPPVSLLNSYRGYIDWGNPCIHYTAHLNHIWALMNKLADNDGGRQTCDAFLLAVLVDLGCSDKSPPTDKYVYEQVKTYELLCKVLGIESKTNEEKHSCLYELYYNVRNFVNSKQDEKGAAGRFISILEDYDKTHAESSHNSVWTFELLEHLIKTQNSPLEKYFAPHTADNSPNAVPESLTDIVTSTKEIRKVLLERMHDQGNAVNIFTTGYFRSFMRSSDDKKPKATFLFAGPPGVGKTLMAEIIAKTLGLPFLRVDMSEYSDKEANLEFCGSDEVYKNSHEGIVTSFVNKNPRCVLLFDEIEKAHINVVHLFLQILDAGRLRDNYSDKEVSFTDAIIIMTTNAGRQLYEDAEGEDISGIPGSVIIDALAKDVNPRTRVPYFPAAICSRFASGNVVMFNHIQATGLQSIARDEMSRRADAVNRTYGISTIIDENVYIALLLAEGGSADARTIRSRTRAFFENEFYELLSLAVPEINVDSITDLRFETALPTGGEIAALFSNSEKPSVLVFSSKEISAQCCKMTNEAVIFGTDTIEQAVEVIKSQRISAVLVDPCYGRPENSEGYLNIEDVESISRDFIRYLKDELKHLPVFLLVTNEKPISEEEKLSLTRIGVRGTIELSDGFGKELSDICSSLYCQASMQRLASANKVLTFETAQILSRDGTHACIKLFDFKLKTAVRAEDSKDILISRPNVKFTDIIGADEAKKELSYFVEYLKNPKKYIGMGARTPKGVLLYGPPGTGKTMLARAMACESGLTFIASEGNSFRKKYQGEGAEAVHKLFRTARKYAPSILFIDEIDAVAMSRTGSDADNSAITALLTELDGFKNDTSRPVFVLAATNVDIMHGTGRGLDPAILRRFDRKALVGLPTKADKKRFIKAKASKNKSFAISEGEIESISVRSVGMSLADLDSIMELSLRCAIRSGSEAVADDTLEDAFETFHSGEMKKWDESQLERVAVHESGHAFVCYSCGETPSYLTIVARDNHGGYMQHSDSEGKAIYTKDELLGKIRTALGGRAAEIAFYGENDGISTGASGDIEHATRIARQMVCGFGMDESFGLGFADESGEASAEVRKAVNKILSLEMNNAIDMVLKNKDKVKKLADALLESSYLIGEQILALLK